MSVIIGYLEELINDLKYIDSKLMFQKASETKRELNNEIMDEINDELYDELSKNEKNIVDFPIT